LACTESVPSPRKGLPCGNNFNFNLNGLIWTLLLFQALLGVMTVGSVVAILSLMNVKNAVKTAKSS
jgi:hypothetical protein